MRYLVLLSLPAALVACSPPPSARDVCAMLVKEGVAEHCTSVPPGGANARALSRWDFDLPSVPGHKGAVLDFESSDDYEATIKQYDSLALLTGPHRYGNQRRRIFVQLNSGASSEVGRKTRAVVEGL